MITIIAGTNRPGSRTSALSRFYLAQFHEAGVEAQVFDLAQFASWQRDEVFIAQEKQFLLHASQFVFILPEYNGSIPGVFKLMLDISDIKSCWYNKKVMLVGLSTGRAGNLRGLDVTTNMCHYLNMHVFPLKLPMSGIQHLMGADGQVHDEPTIALIQQQIQAFIRF
ncbi:MAG: NAD(P)H-dependent oxidoreductase [Chitinophagaceae bacterium]|nr:NAD(P)H-dependent oxidoreductase [Chitinophagaceae bacterium]